MAEPLPLVRIAVRLLTLVLGLLITVTGYRAYLRRKAPYMRDAFVGFAFISMGVAVEELLRYAFGGSTPALEIVAILPFTIGFAMLYLSLRR